MTARGRRPAPTRGTKARPACGYASRPQGGMIGCCRNGPGCMNMRPEAVSGARPCLSTSPVAAPPTGRGASRQQRQSIAPVHADEALGRRLWQTVRWLPVAHRVHQRPLGRLRGVLARRRDPARPHKCLLERLDRPQPAPGQDAGQRGVGLPGPMTHGARSAAAIRVRPAPQTAAARPVAGAASAAATVRTGGRDASPAGAGRRAAARRAAAAATPEPRSAG